MNKYKEIRIKLGLTQRQMAHTLRVHQNTVRSWEQNISEPGDLNSFKLKQLQDVKNG